MLTPLPLLLLNGCITADLWGYDCRPHRYAGRAPVSFVARRHTDWSWWCMLLRTAGTPVTVVLDVLTLPVQSVAFADGIDFHP